MKPGEPGPENAPRDEESSPDQPAGGGAWKWIVGLVVALLVVAALAQGLAMMTAGGAPVEKLLDEVEETLKHRPAPDKLPIPEEMPIPDVGPPTEPRDVEIDDPTEPETGTGVTGHDSH